ncbi:rho-gdp dissociation inhibitor [Xylona heveae TC161]|uniref:Rho GDP-dissociation inhibitor n=1 Tax=Xylona heveae (strain CBS 132557 / TC161) TaxID=1328760 RepID=A0A165HA05_XYLHT|nr:rho-gdp dissociation inhibitor [Xylona heveae TC161]KZF23194.1 rho-gdp dissociation inhibitor [Xylona heveae TC161]
MSNEADDDLAPSRTEGFKLGEKKTLEEYQKLDENDESLRKWKESLGIGSGQSLADSSDPRKAIILSLALEVEGRPDIVVDLTAPGSVETLKSKPFTIKEGARFNMTATFKVQHEVLSGLKYLQVIKRGGIRVRKDEEMIGSYAPSTSDKPSYVKKFAKEDAPSGMMARGHYTATSKFIDDDDNTHLMFEWSFDIKKDW